MERNSSAEERYDPSLTDYIATRWYRAPEILVASKMYVCVIIMFLKKKDKMIRLRNTNYISFVS